MSLNYDCWTSIINSLEYMDKLSIGSTNRFFRQLIKEEYKCKRCKNNIGYIDSQNGESWCKQCDTEYGIHITVSHSCYKEYYASEYINVRLYIKYCRMKIEIHGQFDILTNQEADLIIDRLKQEDTFTEDTFVIQVNSNQYIEIRDGYFKIFNTSFVNISIPLDQVRNELVKMITHIYLTFFY